MAFLYEQKLLFRHCDPAGIAFYPRLFEMMNDCVEAFFDSELNWPFERLHPGNGVPTATISAQFKAPNYLGDILLFTLRVVRLGRSSMDLETLVSCGDQLRMSFSSTLVFINDEGRPTSWPQTVRTLLTERLEQ